MSSVNDTAGREIQLKSVGVTFSGENTDIDSVRSPEGTQPSGGATSADMIVSSGDGNGNDSDGEVHEVIDLGVDIGAVGKAGSWCSYGDEKIGQGKANSVLFLKENPAIAKEIEDKIRAEKLGTKKDTKDAAVEEKDAALASDAAQ